MVKSSLAEDLRERLVGATGVVIVGVGYELGADDGAGLIAAQAVKEKRPQLSVYLTGSAPENYTGPIVKEKPSHVIFIDAADHDASPGSIRIIDKDEIKGARFSTHTLPLSTIMDYLEMTVGANCFALGIQPLHEGFGEGITPEVDRAAHQLAETLGDVLSNLSLD